MDNETNKVLPIKSIIIAVTFFIVIGIYITTNKLKELPWHNQPKVVGVAENSANGVMIPVEWNDLGVQMVKSGVIDKEKFENLYLQRQGFTEVEQKLITDINNGNIVITQENSGVMLNLFWALGLGNKNPILEEGPMMDEQYGGAGNFASTGGWSLAKGNSMDHYSMHAFITLNPEQQLLVERVSKNIYRPCCDNSTYLPDCNHGMAMLGLLELMASQGITEDDMYKTALQVNTLWFPDQYKNINTFLQKSGKDINEVDSKIILSSDYSSSTGYQKIVASMDPQEQKGGAGCGV